MTRGALLLVIAPLIAHAAPRGSSDGVVAPKGRPALPGQAPHAGGQFLYAGYYQMPTAETVGAGARMTQGDPGLAPADSHSLGEVAVMSDDSQQIVEIGWTVDPQVNGDVQPRLFVFHWVDGVPTCYNGCGFVSTSATHKPGLRVTPGAMADYAIALRGSDWWLTYDGVDLGYFPGSLWSAPFTAGHVQWFGEIAASTADSCTEMGNGKRATDPSAAAMSGLYLVGSGGTHVAASAVPGEVTNATYWSLAATSPTQFRFGGPGATVGCCTPHTCADSMAACGTVPDTCGQIACGTCEAQNEVCGATFQCGPAPVGADTTTTEDGDDGGGCCDAGGSPLRALPGLGLLALVLRRRRS